MEQTPAEIGRSAQIARSLAITELAVAIALAHPEDAAVLMAAALEDISAGRPSPWATIFENLRDEAEWWADCANPTELEVYAAAALRRIERTPFGERARKRIFATLWESFAPDDRAAFLARVDPAGRFRGRSA